MDTPGWFAKHLLETIQKTVASSTSPVGTCVLSAQFPKCSFESDEALRIMWNRFCRQEEHLRKFCGAPQKQPREVMVLAFESLQRFINHTSSLHCYDNYSEDALRRCRKTMRKTLKTLRQDGGGSSSGRSCLSTQCAEPPIQIIIASSDDEGQQEQPQERARQESLQESLQESPQESLQESPQASRPSKRQRPWVHQGDEEARNGGQGGLRQLEMDSPQPVAGRELERERGCHNRQPSADSLSQPSPVWQQRAEGQGLSRRKQTLPRKFDACASQSHPSPEGEGVQGQGEARLRLLGCVGGGDAAHEDSDVATPSPLRMQHLGSAPPATPAQERSKGGRGGPRTLGLS